MKRNNACCRVFLNKFYQSNGKLTNKQQHERGVDRHKQGNKVSVTKKNSPSGPKNKRRSIIKKQIQNPLSIKQENTQRIHIGLLSSSFNYFRYNVNESNQIIFLWLLSSLQSSKYFTIKKFKE